MGQPAARAGDRIVASDVHVVMVPSPTGAVPTPLPHPFDGELSARLAASVLIGGKPTAVVGSEAVNAPPHLPQGGPFQKPPSNKGRVLTGSPTVLAEGKPVARNGDTALTCNDPVDLPAGTVVAAGAVLVG